ncbi:hypothetical protein [Paenibacillus naphthalenovorans]|uniref:hypothetical protein n=1 Tax=Paenibacillus naphthalenovorans TaxID=162209 RepID=UPI001587A876|nr:hypothetical protein [Paenibacillus naphthalenovorans]
MAIPSRSNATILIDVQNGFCTRLIKDSQLQIMKPGNEHDKSRANETGDLR